MTAGPRIAAVSLMGAAFVFLLILQFVPWATQDYWPHEAVPGFGWDIHAQLWEVNHDVGFFDAGDSWFDQDDGMATMAGIGGIIVLLALLMSLAAALLLLFDLGAGQGLAWGAVGAFVLGSALFLVGAMDYLEGPTPAAGFYLAVVAAILLFVGAAMAMQRSQIGIRARMRTAPVPQRP